MAVPTLSPEASTALSLLASSGIDWFDDNPLAWEGPSELAPALEGNLPSQWDQILIQNYTFWGRVRGAYATLIDKKKTPGKNDTPLTDLLKSPSKIEIEFFILSPTDLLNLQNIFRYIRDLENGGVNPKPVEVLHPGLKFYGISYLYLEKAGIIRPPTGEEPASTEWHFIEYTLPKSGPAKVSEVKLDRQSSVGVQDGPAPKAPASPADAPTTP
jgi:hypothetical protein